MTAIELKLYNQNEALTLLGMNDSNIDLIQATFDVRVIFTGETLQFVGKDNCMALLICDQLINVIRQGYSIDLRDVASAIEMAKEGHLCMFSKIHNEQIIKAISGKSITPKTLGQSEYVKAIDNNDIVFGIGPAGTGKTYLAVVLAAKAYKEKSIKRIILTRPAVEAGESLGFLPGDLKEKVDPYLRPLYDALFDVFGEEKTKRLIERGVIEIAPLAYMRGRTLDDAFIILDEAQNTTNEQMKMFLTRLGYSSKMVITGDKTQIDLPRSKESGLTIAERTLKKVKDIHFQNFEQSDVVRHPLVAKVIEAYNENEL